jgi:uncharacterized protein (DUF1697 family)
VALVVLLRGLNVGGHRSFRPRVLADQLQHLGAVNIGAAGTFVIGLYRRHMKVIGYLGALDRLFGVPLTTRNWNTLAAVAAVLESSS